MTRPTLVVDGLSIFHSVAGPNAGLVNGFTFSFVQSLTSVVKRFQPKGIFVCWDRTSSKRMELHPGYKGGRVSSMNDVKAKMLEDVRRFLRVVGADQYWAEGHEADDLGAYFANTLEKAVLVSNDKDWLQLVRPNVVVWQKVRGTGVKQVKCEITHENFGEKTGYANPEEFVKALCAMGDGVDCIDGIYGIGDATIKAYLMGVFLPKTNREKLDAFFAGSPLYLRNRALIDLRGTTEIPGLAGEQGTFDEGGVKSLLEELGFASLLKKFPEWVQPYKEAALSDASLPETV